MENNFENDAENEINTFKAVNFSKYMFNNWKVTSFGKKLGILDLIEEKETGIWLNKEGAGKDIQLLDPSPAKMMLFPVTNSPKDFSSLKKDLEKLLKLNHKGENL